MINLLENISLKNFTTFRVEAKARYFAAVSGYEDLKSLILNEQPAKQKNLIIGGGSNLLFTKDFDGWILQSKIKGLEIEKETDTEIFIRVGSGEVWSDFVDYTVAQDWGGLENLSLIPGTVGAAPVQNIGAYGVEQKEIMINLEAMNLETGEIQTFQNEACEFGYRNSIFKNREKGKWFVLNVSYRLKKHPQVQLNYKALNTYFSGKEINKITIKAVSEAVKDIRQSKLPDPEILGNGGSFFKNPIIAKEEFLPLQKKYPDIPFYLLTNGSIKLAAGWLIEQCGWKGKSLGQAAVHHQQALVLVNLGKATGHDILKLARTIQTDVQHQFKIWLEPEVLIL